MEETELIQPSFAHSPEYRIGMFYNGQAYFWDSARIDYIFALLNPEE